MLRLGQRHLEMLDVDINLIDEKEVLRILGFRGTHLQSERQTFLGQNQVCNTLVGNAWETLLPLDVVADVAQVTLNPSNLDLEGMLALASNLLATPAEVI